MTELSRPWRAPAEDAPAGTEWVITPHGDGNVVVLNAAARALLTRCDGTHTVDELAAATAEDTGVEYAQVRADFAAVLADLHAAGLVDEADMPP